MKRCISLLLVLVVCVSLVVPAQAASDPDPAFVDLLALAEESSFIYFPAATTYTARLTVPANLYRYIDCLFYSDVAPSGVGVFVNDIPLTVVHVGDNYYRAYGNFNVPATFVDLVFNFGSVCSTLNIISCRASALARSVYPLGGSWNGYTSFEGSVFESGTFDGSTDVTVDMPYGGSSQYYNYTFGYSLKFYPGINNQWQAYDEIDLLIGINGLALNSVVAYIDNVDVLKSVSLVDNGTYTDLRIRATDDPSNPSYYFEASNDWRWLMITLDLTKVPKSDSYYPQIRLDGLYEAASDPLFTISRCSGVAYDDFDVESSWLKRIFGELKQGFNNLLINFTTWFNLINNNIAEGFHNVLAKLDQFFNDDSSELDEAVKTQEEVNVSINNQLVGAVEDWNTHIEVVESGYGLAVTQTTPALMWLSSLASRVFDNMGWFANIYFLIGLFSVFMLILSKSGLARSIRRNR